MSHPVWLHVRRRAMLGTVRDPRPVTADGALGEALSAIAQQAPASCGKDPALVRLSEIAITSAYLRCGRCPAHAPANAREPAAADPRPALSERSCRHLEKLLSDPPFHHLLHEWLAAVSRAGLQVPPTRLPALLDAGHREPAVRHLVSDVVGPRGRWLAAHNPAWQFASDEALAQHENLLDPGNWRLATQAERVAILPRLREAEPEHARALVQDAFATEHARERAGLLLTLRYGLDTTDEPFLEACLDDRGKEVRRIAADLLASIATSRLVARATERASAWLQVSRTAGNDLELRVTLPKALDTAMIRDGVVELPSKKRGKKAWWLEQVVAMVPPSHWSRLAGSGAEQWIHAAGATEWEGVLIDAWSRAADRHHDPHWAEALLSSRPRQSADLWRHLSPDRREPVFESCMKTAVATGEPLAILSQLGSLPLPWSERFSKVVVRSIRATLRAEATHAGALLLETLRTCGSNMAPSVHEYARQVLAEELGDDVWERPLAEMIELLGFRAAMLRELAT